ncbi:MAG: hypothetical protein WCW44_04540 [archaeon]|jgi:hypothetical protein
MSPSKRRVNVAANSNRSLFETLKSRLTPDEVRALNQQFVRVARINRGAQKGIFLNPENSKIDSDTMKRVHARWEKRAGAPVIGADYLLYKKKGKMQPRRIQSQEVAIRFALKDLIANTIHLKPSLIEKHILEELILSHPHRKFPGTSIAPKMKADILLMRLLNNSSSARARELVEAISNRAIKIQKLAQSKEVYSNTKSDSFINIGSRIGGLITQLELELGDHRFTKDSAHAFAKRIQTQIQQREEERRQLAHMKELEHRKGILREVDAELNKAREDLTTFKEKHHIQ